MRRAKAAVIDKGIAALEPTNFRVVFVTHLLRPHDRVRGPDPHALGVWTARALGGLRSTGNQGHDRASPRSLSRRLRIPHERTCPGPLHRGVLSLRPSGE